MPNSSTHNNRFSKKTIIIALSIVFLVVGLIASFIVVQQSVDVRNRASELSCRMNLVKCSWEWEGELPQGVDSVMYDYTVSGPCNSTELRPCSGTTDNTFIEFEGYPGGAYTCTVEPQVLVSGEKCTVAPIVGKGSCPVDTTTDTETPASSTIERIPGESCSCADDGGKLNCNPSEQKEYDGEDGTGLIVLDPVYEVGDNACFACQKLQVKDSNGKIIREINGCVIGDNEEPIRLHQAPIEPGKCETYIVEAIGGQGEQVEPKTCETCDHTICCPACVPSKNLDVEVASSDPSKPLNVTMVDSCSFQCDFNIDFGESNQCGTVGKTITANVPEGKCIDIDDDYASNKTICDSDNDGIIEFEYDRGGVYDIALDCNELAVSRVIIDGDSGADGIVSALPPDLKCKKRVTVACGAGDTPSTPDDPNVPNIPVTLNDPIENSTSSLTPEDSSISACVQLDVELICHNCSPSQ